MPKGGKSKQAATAATQEEDEDRFLNEAILINQGLRVGGLQHSRIAEEAAEKCCNACGTTEGKLLHCGRCFAVRYCGSACQSRDFAVHMESCRVQYKPSKMKRLRKAEDIDDARLESQGASGKDVVGLANIVQAPELANAILRMGGTDKVVMSTVKDIAYDEEVLLFGDFREQRGFIYPASYNNFPVGCETSHLALSEVLQSEKIYEGKRHCAEQWLAEAKGCPVLASRMWFHNEH